MFGATQLSEHRWEKWMAPAYEPWNAECAADGGAFAPTALAVRMAYAAGITLCAIARADGFEVFTHPQRVAETTVQEPNRVVA